MMTGGEATASNKIQIFESEAAEARKNAKDANDQPSRLKSFVLKGEFVSVFHSG